MNICQTLLAMAAGLAAGFPALGRVIVDTGTPTGACTACAVNLDANQWVAGQFHVTRPTTVAMADGYFGAVGGSGRYFTLAVLSDVGGAPGAVLDSTSAFVKSGVGWNGSDTLDWNLPAAGYYWLAFETGVSDKSAQGLMPVGAPHRLKIIDFGDNGVWAPEGKIGIGVRILRPPDDTKREIAVALTSGALVRGGANAVPEPGDWALMLVGLGVVGTAIRRRRNLATAT